MATTTLQKIKQKYVVTIPKKLVIELRLTVGQEFDISSDESRIILNRVDPHFDAVMAAHRKVTKKYRKALQRLADA